MSARTCTCHPRERPPVCQQRYALTDCHAAYLAKVEAGHGVHSEDFVVMFLGYLTAAIPELRTASAPRVLEAWQAFKAEMGKR